MELFIDKCRCSFVSNNKEIHSDIDVHITFLTWSILIPGGTVVTLQGSEWIGYVISDVTDRTHSPINKVALEFKVGNIIQ